MGQYIFYLKIKALMRLDKIVGTKIKLIKFKLTEIIFMWPHLALIIFLDLFGIDVIKFSVNLFLIHIVTGFIQIFKKIG